MFKGRAELEATGAFLKKSEVHAEQQREFCGVKVSSLAVGTYLGRMDEATDAKVTAACMEAFSLGSNFFDTAINYRAQRAERAVGEAIRRLLLSGKARREEFFVSTKGGFIPHDRDATADLGALFQKDYVESGTVSTHDLIAGCHCLEPRYISDQLERSRRNLGLETIDLYYLHNPETQLEELPERVFYSKLEACFEALEEAVANKKLGSYGLATWSGLREGPGAQLHINLERCVELASRVAQKLGGGAARSSFRAVQLPLNLAMPEATLVATQKLQGTEVSAAAAARKLGLDVAVSVPLFQARLCHGVPDFIIEKFPARYSQAHCALAFATSFDEVGAAMVGMKELEHVRHNLSFLREPALTVDELAGVVQAMLA